MKNFYAIREAYVTALLVLLCAVFAATAVQGEPKTPKIKLTICNPVSLAQRLEWIHDWNHYRGHAIIKADSSGITPEECLALMSGESSDEECEFYHQLWNTNP